MIAGFNIWLNVPDDALKKIENIISMLHNASLLYVNDRGSNAPLFTDLFYRVDDVEDNSTLRRGYPGMQTGQMASTLILKVCHG